MKSVVGLYALCCTIIGVSPTAPGAAPPVRWSVVAGGGATFPLSGDTVQEGLEWGPAATLGVAAQLTPLEFVGRTTFTSYDRNDAGVLERSGLASRPVNVLDLNGGTMTTVDFVADVRYYPGQGNSRARTHPFLVGALGVCTYRYEGVDIQYQYAGHTWPAGLESRSGTNASVGAGAGLRFDLGTRWGMVIEGRYERILVEGDDLQSAPVRVELRFAP